MADNSASFEILVRVYYEDTDSGGIVYYANYLKYMERARTEFLRSLGVEQELLRSSSKRLFVVKTVSVNYVKPAKFNSLLRVFAMPVSIKRASLVFDQQIVLANDPNGAIDPHGAIDAHGAIEAGAENLSHLICEGQVRIACLHSETRKPANIPTTLLELFR